MQYVLFVWAAAFMLSLFEKKASTRTGEMASTFSFVGVRNLIGVVLSLAVVLVLGKGFNFTPTLILSALIFGVLVVVDIVNLMYLAKSGVMALVMVCGYAGSIVVPSVVGMIFWDAPVRPIQWLFVAVLLVASYILCDTSKGMYNFNIKTVGMLVIRFVVNGLGSVATGVYAKSGEGNENLFLCASYFFSAAIALMVAVILSASKKRANGEIKNDFKIDKKYMLLGMGSMVATYLINLFTTIAQGVLDPVIFFPLSAVGSITTAALVGAIFFKERFTVKSVIGIVLACASVALINIL